MGLGGDDSWTRSVHKRFLVQPGRFDFGIRLRVLPPGADADRVYRHAFTGGGPPGGGGGMLNCERTANSAAAAIATGAVMAQRVV